MNALTTSRLLLRQWREEDLAPFAAMNTDPRVVESLYYALSRDESDAMVARIRAQFAERGYGLWAVEEIGGAPFIGTVGLSVPRIVLPFTPCVEVGWRLAPAYWGNGYATEAASAALEYGFDRAGLDEIVSFTAAMNGRSRRVMERLGMTTVAEDNFDHPNIPEGNPLFPHVLYRLGASDRRSGVTQK